MFKQTTQTNIIISKIAFCLFQKAMLKLMQGDHRFPVKHTLLSYKYQGNSHAPFVCQCTDTYQVEINFVEGNVTLLAAPNPFLYILYEYNLFEPRLSVFLYIG